MRTSLVERLKTVILIGLVLSSMTLTYRLWFQDHNLFSILGVFSEKKAVQNQNALEYVYSPPRILFNMDEKAHVIIRPNNAEYPKLQKEGNSLIKNILASQDYESVDMSKWNKLLPQRSILFSYDVKMDSDLLAKLLNVSNPVITKNIPFIKDLIVIQDKTVTNNIKCYIRDEEKNRLYKVEFNYNDGNLDNLLASIEGQNLSNYMTGFEFKNKAQNEKINYSMKDDVLFLVTDNDILGKQAKLTNEFDLSSDGDVKEVIEKFFEKFNIVKNIEFKDDSKTKVIKKEFIDRKRIVKIYSSGQIEYTSAELTSDAHADLATSVKSAVNFIQSNLGFPQYSYLSEIVTLSDSSGYKFSFDYSVDGLDVKLKGGDIPKHAIEIEVKGGKVTSYKRLVKQFGLGKERKLDVLDLEAANDVLKKNYTKDEKKDSIKPVGRVDLVYVDDGASVDIFPSWYVDINGEQFFENSVSEEK